MCAVRSSPKEVEVENAIPTNNRVSANLKDEITRLYQLENVQKSIDKPVMSLPCNLQSSNSEVTRKPKSHSKKKKNPALASSNNNNRPNFIRSPCSPLSASRQFIESDTKNIAPESPNNSASKDGAFTESEKENCAKAEEGGDASSREVTPTPGYRRSSSVNMKKMKRMLQNAAEENVRSIREYVTQLKERVAKLQCQKQLLVCQVLDLETNEAAGYNLENEDGTNEPDQPQVPWSLTFKEQRQQIIELWGNCFVSIIHRTQFYLLFKGDQADQIYLEVELRKLNWLLQHFAELGNATPAHVDDEPIISISSSIKALRREREFLAKKLTPNHGGERFAVH